MSFVNDQQATRVVVRAATATECTRRQDRSAGSCADTIGAFCVTHALTTTQAQILHRLSPFYGQLDDSHLVCDVIAQRSNVSLRAIDWLVTNFGKKHNICLAANVFNIHQNYKTALQQYRRRNFDPFRRRLRIQLCIGQEIYDTTVGQLNFMHWAYVTGVLGYARDHLEAIERDMNDTAAAAKKRRDRNCAGPRGERKRNELSRAPHTKCNIFTADLCVRFGAGAS